MLVELQDAWIPRRSGCVALNDKYVSIASDGDVIRLVEKMARLIPIAPLSFRAQRQQHVTLRVQFHDRVSANISRPDITVVVDLQTVRAREKAFAKGSNELSISIELEESLGSAGE